ncbi:MAG: DoxX family protein [Chloroflexi bacterium]|nr:MAG: DoxX family protein [Chloroflexota bacterium]MBL1193036.1 DoxX family protein [Chloroflexota bacterium]NOH10329.1 DoxX family protein [Chloroflexota bacterium]
MDLFNFLTVDQWLAILRIGIGLWWLKSVFHKDLRSFVTKGMSNWTVALAENHPVEPFGKLIGNMVDKNRSWFPYLVVLGEFAVGVGLVFGFLTPISLAVAIFLNLNYIALAGVKPKDISVNECYQCEQGQNYNMIVPQFVLLALGGWNVWSLDSLVGLF